MPDENRISSGRWGFGAYFLNVLFLPIFMIARVAAGPPRTYTIRRQSDMAGTNGKAGKVSVLVGTTKGAFFFHSDAKRKQWEMTGPHLDGWEIYRLCGVGGNGHG